MSAREGLSSAANHHRFSSAASEGGHMIRSFSRATLVALALAGAVSPLRAQQPASAQGSGAAGPAPDVIFSNGKIITVDERFTIAQAIAVRGDRIVAVGSDAEVLKLATPATRRIDLTWHG